MLDVKSIFIDTFIKLIETYIGFIVVFFAVSILIFMFKDELQNHFELTWREKNKLSAKALFSSLTLGTLIIAYLFINQYFFALALIISVILTYIFYLLGFFDRVIEKFESRY